MPKAAKRIQGRRGSRAARAKNPAAKRMAYGNKYRMAKKNAPLKETKNRTDEDVHARFAAGQPVSYYNQNPLVPHAWPTADKVFPLKMFSLDAQQQGIDEDMMNGRALFAKYLKMKIQLSFPESTNIPQDQPDVYIVHGWIKKSPNLNGIQAIQGVVDPENWTIQNDWDFIRAELEPYFDEREDKLRYIPKQNSNLAIVDYHRVKPKQRQGFGRVRTTLGTITSDPATTELRTVGTLMDYHRTLKWNMYRKVHYEVGAASTFQSEAAHISRSNGLFINMNQWRPFACLYCPQYGVNGGVNPPLVAANLPKVAYNSILYYTDS